MTINNLLQGTIPQRLLIQRSKKTKKDIVASQLILLLILCNQRPGQARFLHCLKTEKQDLENKLLLCRRHPKSGQNKNRTKHVGLGGEYLFRQSQFLFIVHFLHGLNGS